MLKEAFSSKKIQKPQRKDLQILYLTNGSFCTPAKVTINTFKRQMVKWKKYLQHLKQKNG